MKKKNYRLTCLISQQTKDIKKVYENILNLVKEQGEITYKQEPIQKSLAYPIKKEKGAFLIDIFFTISVSFARCIKNISGYFFANMSINYFFVV